MFPIKYPITIFYRFHTLSTLYYAFIRCLCFIMLSYAVYALLCFLYAFTMLPYHFHTLSNAFKRFQKLSNALKRAQTLSYAFSYTFIPLYTPSYGFIRFHTLSYAFIYCFGTERVRWNKKKKKKR